MNILTILLSLQYIKKSPINTKQIALFTGLINIRFILEISEANLFAFYTIPCAVIALAQISSVYAVFRHICIL